MNAVALRVPDWIQGPGCWMADPYRCYVESDGHWSAWVYGKHGPKILQRSCATATRAKALCDEHRKRNAGKW